MRRSKARFLKSQLLHAALAGLYLAGLALGQGNTVTSAGRPVSEYEVKAAFLLNFIRFVEWPPVPPGSPKEPFSICMIGDDPFRGALDRQIEEENINGRPIIIRRLLRWQEPCQVLFVSASERDAFRVLLQAGPGVLTVGESSGFLSDGGMINFVVDDRRVRFDVSLKNAANASVKISSRLLSVARTVSR